MARGRSPYANEELKIPQSSFMGYYFPWNSSKNTYDTSSFNSAYSDNRITHQDIQVLKDDLQSQPLLSPVYCDPLQYGFPVIALLFLLSIVLLISTSSSKNGTLMLYFLIPLMIGLFIGVVVICFKVEINEQKRIIDRKAQLEQVIARQQEITFSSKDVVLWMSYHGSFIAIEFAFRMEGIKDGSMQPGQAPVYNMNPYQQPYFSQLGPLCSYMQPQPQFAAAHQPPSNAGAQHRPYFAGNYPQPIEVAGRQPQAHKPSPPVF